MTLAESQQQGTSLVTAFLPIKPKLLKGLPQSIVKSVLVLPTRQKTVGNLLENPEVLEILETRINRTNRKRNRILATRVLDGIRRKAKVTVKEKEKLMKLMLLMRP